MTDNDEQRADQVEPKDAIAAGVVWPALLVPLLGCLAFAVLDAMAIVATSSHGLGATAWPARFVYVAPWFLVASAGLAMLGRAAAELFGAAADRAGVHLDATERRAASCALAVASALLVSGAYQLILWSARAFRNHRLAAMLVVIGLLALLTACALIGAFVFRALSRKAKTKPLRWAQAAARLLALPSLLVAAGYVVHNNHEGLAIIGGWFLAGPVALLLVMVVSWILVRRRARGGGATRAVSWRVVLAGLSATVGASVAVGSIASKALPQGIVESDSWSAHIMVVGRALTDVDRDGFSSLFGGGDCAPFDGTRSPGTLEVFNDGIDNDCYGGDAIHKPPPQRPKWYPRTGAKPIEHAVVIVIEALRVDAVSYLRGTGPTTTPNIDKLAARSIVLPRTYAAAPVTLWSMASFWTSFPPTQIHWTRRPNNDLRFLDNDVRLIPERLQDAGFRTGAFTVTFHRLEPKTGIGLDRGFHKYDARLKASGWRGHPSQMMVKRWQPFMTGGKRSLSWLHFVEPHYPYVRHPAAPDFGKSQRDLYHSEVWTADKAVGDVIAHLEKNGLLDKTLVVVTGDHAEAFGEHGRYKHGSQLFDEQVRTMMVMWVPGMAHRIIDMPVSHQDLGSTMMNLLNVKDGFDELNGLNLIPYFEGKQVERDSPVRFECHSKRLRAIATVQGDFKLIYKPSTGRGELFNLKDDPAEKKNLIASRPLIYAEMMVELRAHAATQISYD